MSVELDRRDEAYVMTLNRPKALNAVVGSDRSDQ